MIRIHRAAAVLAIIAIASAARPAAAQTTLGFEELRALIARNHPKVYSDARLNAVLIVVDTSGGYVASLADSLPPAVIAALDSVFASVGARNEAEAAGRPAPVADTAGQARWHRLIDSTRREWLTRMGIRAESIDMENMEMRHLRAGLIGPNALLVTIMSRKGS
jgi:hypothetical protein